MKIHLTQTFQRLSLIIKELIYISGNFTLLENKKSLGKIKYFKQVCIYGFNKKDLELFKSEKKTLLKTKKILKL